MNIQLGRYDLLINNVSKIDEGFYECSGISNPDSSTIWKLIVIENGVSCSTENETCADEFNVTCKATYAGNCAPRLQLSTEGRTPPGNETRVIKIGNSVSLMTLAHRTHVPMCVVATQSTLLKSTCQVSVFKETTIEHVSHQIKNIIIPVISICLIIALVIFAYVKRKKILACVIRMRRGSSDEMERSAVSEREQHHEIVEKLCMVNMSSLIPNLSHASI